MPRRVIADAFVLRSGSMTATAFLVFQYRCAVFAAIWSVTRDWWEVNAHLHRLVLRQP